MVDRRNLLAGKVVSGNLRGVSTRVAWHLCSGTVLLAIADGFQSVGVAVAADDNQLALFQTEWDSGCFRSALDRDRLVVGHAIHDIESALRRKAREELASDLLALCRIPKGIFGRNHLDLRIGLDCFIETLDPSKAIALRE